MGKKETAVATVEQEDKITPANFPTKIDVGRKGDVFTYKFDNVKMDKEGKWTMTIALEGDVKEFSVAHSCAFVLNPEPTEEFLMSKRNAFLSPQTELELDGDGIVQRMERQLVQYHKDANAFGTHDFDVGIRKVDRGNVTKLTFRISQRTAMMVVENIDLFMTDKAAIVFGEYRNNGATQYENDFYPA